MTDTSHHPKAQIQTLIEGHRRFREEVFPGRREQFHLLAEMQNPQYLFITCSDSRVLPDLILQTGPGDLFITRNAGNVIPVSGDDDGATATIEYAVEMLKVKHAILCGHSDCGALKAALYQPDLKAMPKAARWLGHVEEAFTHRQPPNPADGDNAELVSVIKGNVIAQLANLRAQPSVAKAISHGHLTVHGWYYDILSGQIEVFDEHTRTFSALLAGPD